MTADLKHVAIVPLTPHAPETEIAVVAAALQKQVLRDFAPLWGCTATVDYFPTLDAVPIGYWPLFLVDNAPAAGTHIDHAGMPVAYVEYGVSWSLSASHELLEMLVDPRGTYTIAGDSPIDDARVEFLVEVCDPCQDAAHGYAVNGALVSDFYTPAFFDPSFTTGSKYSFTGALQAPRSVAAGGYLTWRDPATGHWTQLHDDGATKDLGALPGTLGFRNAVDAASPARRLSHVPDDHPRSRAITARRQAARSSIDARNRAWRELSRRLCGTET
jgi:hypothetical protein